LWQKGHVALPAGCIDIIIIIKANMSLGKKLIYKCLHHLARTCKEERCSFWPVDACCRWLVVEGSSGS
jgi:hypothetical protein